MIDQMRQVLFFSAIIVVLVVKPLHHTLYTLFSETFLHFSIKPS